MTGTLPEQGVAAARLSGQHSGTSLAGRHTTTEKAGCTASPARRSRSGRHVRLAAGIAADLAGDAAAGAAAGAAILGTTAATRHTAAAEPRTAMNTAAGTTAAEPRTAAAWTAAGWGRAAATGRAAERRGGRARATAVAAVGRRAAAWRRTGLARGSPARAGAAAAEASRPAGRRPAVAIARAGSRRWCPTRRCGSTARPWRTCGASSRAAAAARAGGRPAGAAAGRTTWAWGDGQREAGGQGTRREKVTVLGERNGATGAGRVGRGDSTFWRFKICRPVQGVRWLYAGRLVLFFCDVSEARICRDQPRGGVMETPH